jgi:hypothetical protein
MILCLKPGDAGFAIQEIVMLLPILVRRGAVLIHTTKKARIARAFLFAPWCG